MTFNRITPTWLHRAQILLRLLFAGMLIYASADKLLNPLEFSHAVSNYQLTGLRLSRWVAISLPYLELLLGLLLLAGVWLDAAGLLNFLLMMLFLTVVSQAYSRGLEINCGCFSVDGNTRIGADDLAINLLLAAASALLMWLNFRKPSGASDR